MSHGAPPLQGRVQARKAAEAKQERAVQRRQARQVGLEKGFQAAAEEDVASFPDRAARWNACGIVAVCGLGLESVCEVNQALQGLGADGTERLRCADFGNNSLSTLSGACRSFMTAPRTARVRSGLLGPCAPCIVHL
jgi:hypothetical protein